MVSQSRIIVKMANENCHQDDQTPEKRRRRNSSSSSSSSRSSAEESFIKDSDDSVRVPNFTITKAIEESSDDDEAYTLTTLTTVPLNEMSQDLINSTGIENCVSSFIDQFIATSEDPIVTDLICDQEKNAYTPQDEAREDVVENNSKNKTNEISPTKKGKRKQRRDTTQSRRIVKRANENYHQDDQTPEKRRRRNSSSSSSSSRSSAEESFIEYSDDSVRVPNFTINKVIEESSDDDEAYTMTTLTTVPLNEMSQDLINSTGIENCVSCSIDQFIATSEEPIVTDMVCDQEKNAYTPQDEAREDVIKNNSKNKTNEISPTKKGKKKQRREEKWKKNIAKELRNTGKSYISIRTMKVVPERQIKEPCKDNCSFKCQINFTVEQRKQLNGDYWNLGSIEKQWTFVANSTEVIVPKVRYVKIDSEGNQIQSKRKHVNAYYFMSSGKKIRVCKLFFKNTLAINNRPIETALKKKNNDTIIFTMKDKRGSHGKQPKVNDDLKAGVLSFINAIPKIESHYTRANTTKQYIDGSKSVADLHRDYVKLCKYNNAPCTSYAIFYRIFSHDFNISFFTPKKDLCDTCEAYKNCSDEEKILMKESYDKHIREKQLSRIEKENDKKKTDTVVAVYDLQAVFQCPKGEISVFYYKSKLNVLNLTIYDTQQNQVESFVWDESNANRGVNEIGTCVFNYLVKVCGAGKDLDVIFYSDNCPSQQKNKFMVAMYLFAVQYFPNLKSITHKFLIKGHTKNEGDSAHSQIERQVKRQLRSGPMYTPDAFIAAIKASRKKSVPIHVTEMCYSDIYDWMDVCSQMNLTINKDENKRSVKLACLKVIMVQKSEPRAIYFKTSYEETEFQKALVIKRKKDIDIEVKRAYTIKPGLADRKKSDLIDLIDKKMIPSYYRAFFEAL